VTAAPPTDDREARRQLWRAWVASDVPQGEARVRRRVPRPAESPGASAVDAVIDAPEPVVRGLVRAVEASLIGGDLSAGERRRLIRRATRLGLGRFEANLLIAAVQHRARKSGRRVVVHEVRRAPSVLRIVAGAILLESVAVVALLRVVA